MKSRLVEVDAKKRMQTQYPGMIQPGMSTYENFAEIADKYDCVAFRQIDQDIGEFRFPAYYYTETLDQQMSTAANKGEVGEALGVAYENKLKADKYKMRNLLRQLLVWGKTFRKEKKAYQFCYPTGFMKFAHRLVNLMSVEEAFWIVVGLVRHYPRLWCLEESSLLGNTKTNFRFEATVVKAAVDTFFPRVAKKLRELGMPVEMLVYDSVTSFYCDQFHSDTLVRIWDMMIFYLNTTDAANKANALHLILAPALLIIKAKEEQILAA